MQSRAIGRITCELMATIATLITSICRPGKRSRRSTAGTPKVVSNRKHRFRARLEVVVPAAIALLGSCDERDFGCGTVLLNTGILRAAEQKVESCGSSIFLS